MSRLPAIGITCYASAGGSGVIATELGLNLARSGYSVHFITSQLPLRLRRFRRNILYHPVEVPSYPVFLHPPYTLSLATAMSNVAIEHGLDILHVHYAIPHAASAFLAREMVGGGRLKVITTLHGTDITLVGQEPSFFPMTRFVIERSDAVTAVSEFLRLETQQVFGVTRPITVIPNFVDTRRFHPRECPRRRARLAEPHERILMHASNFRPVKNLAAVVGVFARIARDLPARLVLVGEGPELPRVRAQAEAEGVADRLVLLGQVDDLEALLPCADLVLLPSWHESFGLVALEAMACGVPVVATTRGGTGEFIVDGVNGMLREPDDYDGMAAAVRHLLSDDNARSHMGEEARRDAVERFGARCILKQYVDLYDRVCSSAG
ncbi:MAG: N-acetyl-alpha-D-glucosaminyl L-malate synthase BshA [Candidatus Krumholzibacteriia bacterium]